jgi:uncharacterized protein with von Willebrand factor type A (vWA) domain
MNAVALDPPILRNVLLFGRILRRSGIPVSPDQSRSFVRALGWVDLSRREQVFHTARSLLVHRQEDLALFEILFNRFWRRPGEAFGPHPRRPQAPRQRRRQIEPVDGVAFFAGKAEAEDPEVDVADKAGTFSPHELLQRKDFSEMTDEELAAVRRLIAETRWKASLRRTRRMIPDARGSRLSWPTSAARSSNGRWSCWPTSAARWRSTRVSCCSSSTV